MLPSHLLLSFQRELHCMVIKLITEEVFFKSFPSSVFRGSSDCIVTRLRPGQPEFNSRHRLGIFLLATASRLALSHVT
jgi:hypothetical protein